MIEILIYLASLTSFAIDTEHCQENPRGMGFYTYTISTKEDYISLCIENMKNMNVYNYDTLLMVISHELGHLYWFQFMSENEKSEWIEMESDDFYISKNTFEEDFAEMFSSLYVPFFRNEIKIRSPLFRQKQDFIRELIFNEKLLK